MDVFRSRLSGHFEIKDKISNHFKVKLITDFLMDNRPIIPLNTFVYEMYFGVDVLTRDNELIPIQWKGFEESEEKYQGEISDKNYVQQEFRKKLQKEIMTETKELTELLEEIYNAYK